MAKYFLKTCSILLVIVLLVNMLPMHIFGEVFREGLSTKGTVDKDVVLESEIIADAYVVDELADKRTEFSKEFVLSNGLHLAAVYADPVHYETDGGWEEIDNTLKANADGTYSNTEGIWGIRLPQQLSGEERVTLEKDGYTLSFSLDGELNTGSAAVYGLGSKRFDVKQAKQTKGNIQETDWSEMRQYAEFEEMVPEKSKSRLAYLDIYENTDIIYDLDSNTLKESVVLERYSETLRGYSYTLEVGSMIPVLEENGQITFYDKDKENIVMVMPAPYLVDDMQTYSYDVEVQLTGRDSTYTLNYLLPTDWLAAADRAWPVVLDPIVEGDTAARNIQDRTIAENTTYAHNGNILEVGYTVGTGVHRAFLKYDSLPSITSSDVVVYAEMNLYKLETSSKEVIVEAHKVTEAWTSQGITWAGQPAWNESVEDYNAVRQQGGYRWIITDIVRDWYATANNGLMFKASADAENASENNYKQFASSDLGTTGTKPILLVYFRNNNGLESYWDYTSSSAGRAGTGYVNNFTGNLVWTRDDIGFGGSRMPVSIQHVYNLNDAIVPNDNNNSNDSGFNSFGMGIGWRTNFNQLLYRWNIDSTYYIWEDGDGTDHYFKADNGVYKDEDGLELTLTDSGSGTEKYFIEDKNGNRSYFDEQGRLTKLSNNQQTKSHITVTYVDATSNRIDMVTDGAGRVYDYCYDGMLLSRISYKGTDGIEKHFVAFAYDGIQLTRIGDGGGALSTYMYNGNGLLGCIQDVDGYRLNFEYTTRNEDYQPYRVRCVSESQYIDGNTIKDGGVLTFDYAHNQVTITDHNGSVERHQFNDLGNTISIQDDEGHAQYTQYAKNKHTDNNKSNQMSLSSKLQNTVANWVWDMSFEGYSTWNCDTGMSCSAVSTEKYSGLSSLQISGPGRHVTKFSITVPNGESCTFSAYMKSAANTAAWLALVDSTGASTISGYLNGGDSESQWGRLQASYTNNTGVTQTVEARTYVNGTAYMDCVQLERNPTASRYNIIDNGDFSVGSHGWSTGDGFTVTAQSTSAAPELGSNAFTVTGDPTNAKRSYQHIQCQGEAGDTLVLSGWAKGDSVPLSGNRKFGLRVKLEYTDGSSKEAIAHFNPDTDSHDSWQYAAVHIVAEKPFRTVKIELMYDYNANTVSFDGIQLFKEEFGSSYTYDDNGNVISVEDLQGQTTTYEYAQNNLTKIIQNNNAKVTYTYDDHHNVKTATTQEGQVYSFEYDTYGNNTSVSVGSGSTKITSTATYSSDGNRLVSTTDSAGKVTTYGYNALTNFLEWVQYPEDTEATRTTYTYDALYRMASAAVTTDTGEQLSASYSYTNDLLTGIQTATTAYGFSYGAFAQRTGISVGNRTLASYSYTNDRNRYLSALDYGNGDRVQYTYDNKGRVTKQTYEDGDTVSYQYDNDGALATVTDSATGEKITYYYDLTDRMMKYVESQGGTNHSVSYLYDTRNNLISVQDVRLGITHGLEYSYDEDNRITTVTSGSVSKDYSYDDWGRVSQQQSKHNGAVVKTEAYTYENAGDNGTSGRIATHYVSNFNTTYSFAYDDNGNLLSVTDGNYITTYVYDSANQLIRENNSDAGYTYTWTYDNGGNLLSKTEYPYTEGTLGSPTRTIHYTYGDSEWKDLLTGYDGKTITSDAIGNMLSDGTNTYTWKHGRQLDTMTNSGHYVEYTYGADGRRISKTINGEVHTFTWVGDKIVQENYADVEKKFFYDAEGRPDHFTYNGDLYYYVLNIMGDVTGILDSNGNLCGSYLYDAWGRTVYQSGYGADLNPIRYRGYLYDGESGLYYVSSRYYDPEIGRWINADGQISGVGGDIRGYNMFAYCFNNPVNMIDPTGNWPSWGQVFAAVATVAVAAVFVAAVVASAGAVGVAAGVAAASIGATGTMVSAAITVGTVGTYAVAAGIGACALSNAGEILTGTNVIRDGLMGGNQEAYDTVQTALNIAGGGAVIIGQTNPGVTGNAAKPNQNAQTVHKVPTTGTANTSFDKLYPGKTGDFQRTYYDFRGNMSLQIDFTTHNNPLAHSNPHLHTFWLGQRQPQINLWYLE